MPSEQDKAQLREMAQLHKIWREFDERQAKKEARLSPVTVVLWIGGLILGSCIWTCWLSRLF